MGNLDNTEGHQDPATSVPLWKVLWPLVAVVPAVAAMLTDSRPLALVLLVPYTLALAVSIWLRMRQ